MTNISSARRMLLLAAAGLVGTEAHAGAFYLQEQSVRGAGRAFSGEVADQGAASLWWNPAAIGGVTGFSGYGGFSAILPKGHVDNVATRIVRPGQAPALVGGDARSNDPINNGYLPSGAIAYGLSDKLALGLATTSPFSFTTNYPSSSWVRYTADKTKLRIFDIQPSIAFSPVPAISIGAAANVEYAYASLSNSLPNLSPLLPDGHQTLKGDGWDVGYSVGAQGHFGPVTLGVSYKSSVKHTLKGAVTTAGLLGPLAAQNRSIATKASFRTPWQLDFGARVKLGERVTLNGQVVRYGWNKFDTIDLAAPLNVSIPEDYRSTWSYAGGVDFALTPKATLRAGVQRDHTPTRNGERDARVPDSNRWNFAGGGSYELRPGMIIDAAVNYIHFKDASIDRVTAAYAGTAAQTPILVNGRLDGAHAVVLSLGGRLSF